MALAALSGVGKFANASASSRNSICSSQIPGGEMREAITGF
jgi:hypothetical protein